jgi:superfamily II DNA or RNA helicase
MQLRDYQIPAVDAIVAVTRGIVKAPAGSGKTVIAAAAINRWTGRNMPTPTVIWYAHTTDQCDQARKACDAMGLVDIQIDIVCYQSGKSAEGYTIAILDECHHIASPEFRKVLEGYTGIRWGFSATPDRADELMDDVYTLIGPIVYEVPRDILVEAGNLAPAKVYFHAPNERDSLAEPIEVRRAAPRREDGVCGQSHRNETFDAADGPRAHDERSGSAGPPARAERR